MRSPFSYHTCLQRLKATVHIESGTYPYVVTSASSLVRFYVDEARTGVPSSPVSVEGELFFVNLWEYGSIVGLSISLLSYFRAHK